MLNYDIELETTDETLITIMTEDVIAVGNFIQIAGPLLGSSQRFCKFAVIQKIIPVIRKSRDGDIRADNSILIVRKL